MTLYASLTAPDRPSLSRDVTMVILATLLLTLSAKIALPFYPVPLTLQTLVVLGVGLTLGPRLGGAAIVLYLIEGAIGLPVFAGTPERGLGLAYMVGPTGGYLVGFLAAVLVTGTLARLGWDRRPLTAFAAALAGTAVIYLPGLLWLGIYLGWDQPILAWGLTPFLFGDLIKAALAALCFPVVWSTLRRQGMV